MESDGRRRLRTLHCMKCGAPLVTRTTPVKPEHIPVHLQNSPHNVLTRQVCSKEGCDWVVSLRPARHRRYSCSCEGGLEKRGMGASDGKLTLSSRAVPLSVC